MRLELKRQNGIDNINNSKDDNDHYYSKYAVARAQFPPKEKPRQKDNVFTKKLREQAEKFDWTGMSFPTPLHEWDIFENLNKRSVMVLGYDDNENKIVYIRHIS